MTKNSLANTILKLRRTTTQQLLLTACVGGCLTSLAKATTFVTYYAGRNMGFEQTNTDAPVTTDSRLVLEAEAVKDPRDPESPSPTPTVIGTGTNQVFTPGTGSSPVRLNVFIDEFDDSYALASNSVSTGAGISPADLEAAYSSQPYNFDLTGTSRNITMLPLPSGVPTLTNPASDWSNGALNILAGEDFTVMFNAFVGQINESQFNTNRRDAASFVFFDAEGNQVLFSGSLGSTTEDFLVPAGTFSPGQMASGQLRFLRYYEEISYDETSPSNIVTAHESTATEFITSFQILIVPEPSSAALLSLSMAIGCFARSRARA